MDFAHGYDAEVGNSSDIDEDPSVNFSAFESQPRGAPWLYRRAPRRQRLHRPVATLVRNRRNYGENQVTRLSREAVRTVNDTGAGTILLARRLMRWSDYRGPWPETVSLNDPREFSAHDWQVLKNFVYRQIESGHRNESRPHWRITTMLRNFDRNIERLIQASQVVTAFVNEHDAVDINNPDWIH